MKNGWKKIPLGEIVEIKTGKTPSRRISTYFAGAIPWVKTTEVVNGVILDTEEKLTTAGVESCNNPIFPEDTLLIALYGQGQTRGRTAKLGIAATTNQACAALLPSELIQTNYLWHFLRSQYTKLRELSRGGNQPNLNLQIVRSFEIPLPPLAEQMRIADILDKADAIRRKRRQAIGLAEQFVHSTFLKMFGDPVANPKQWAVNKLQEMSTCITSGSTPPGGKRVYVAKGITFFRSQNVWRNRLALDDIAYIDEETHRKLSKSSLKKRDILITKTGRFNTENSSLGRAAMFIGEDDSANVNGHVYLVRLQESAIHEFVLFILTTDEYREYIRSVCVGGIDKRQINKEHLEAFPIISPPRELQLQFATIVRSVDRQMERMRTYLKEADALFFSLQSRAFRGEL